MAIKKDPITRINPHDDVDSWLTDFDGRITFAVDQPITEIFTEGSELSDWRLSYGIASKEPVVYFIAFYPPFCFNAKAKYHYNHLSELAKDVLTLENFLVLNNDPEDLTLIDGDAQDIIAAVFSILRDKESIELFQEQKDLMELGIKHYHLDNYYQDVIKKLCNSYYEDGTILGKKLCLTILNKVSNNV